MIVAIGGGLAVYEMLFYADQKSYQYAPELVAYTYFQLPDNFLLRTGLRVNYAWNQTHSTQALQISQTDFRYFAEIGIAYNWIIIPDISIGFGADYFSKKLTTKPPIYVPKDNISYAENLAATYFQGSIGFPLIKGALVFEPYVRYTFIQNPGDNAFGYGIEMTIQIL